MEAGVAAVAAAAVVVADDALLEGTAASEVDGESVGGACSEAAGLEVEEAWAAADPPLSWLTTSWMLLANLSPGSSE